MSTVCCLCEAPAGIQCKCNSKIYCQKDFDKHCKKKGKHEAIFLDDSSLIRKAVSFVGNEGGNKPDKPNEVEAIEIESNKKNILRAFLEREIAKIQMFKATTIACVAAQQQSLIRNVIVDSKTLIGNVINECKEKEELLNTGFNDLSVIGKIPFGNPAIERLKKKSLGQSILIRTGNITKTELHPSKILEFSIDWVPNPIMNELKDYYTSHQGTIPNKLKKIYEKIFSEGHYTVKKLNLSKSKVDKLSLEHLKRIIGFIPNIKELKLSGNKINNESCDILAECLNSLRKIEKLDLSENDLRGHGVEVLTPVLEEMKILTHLNLAKNNLGATGARQLSIMLESLKKVKDLDLDNNAFGAEGARYLSRALPKLSTLKILKLRNNNFADDSVKFIKSALGKLQNIELLKLELNKFSNEEKRTMQLIVRKECKIEF